MFLRRHRKVSEGEAYDYWTLVKTVRTARGPRHQMVANLGKLEAQEVRTRRGWQHIEELLDGRSRAANSPQRQPASQVPSR